MTGASSGIGFELATFANRTTWSFSTNRVTPDSVKAVASRLIFLPVGRN